MSTSTRSSWTRNLFLICSDGLTSMVSDEAILKLVNDHPGELQATAKALVAAANRGGGDDNITVIVFALESDGEAATRRMDAIAAPDDGDPEDEDTLSGLEAPPTVGTMVMSVEELK
jgi:PPM family protein phosphatase